MKLKNTRLMQHDNDPKHMSKPTSEWLKKQKTKDKIKLKFRSVQVSLDLNPIDQFWHSINFNFIAVLFI